MTFTTPLSVADMPRAVISLDKPMPLRDALAAFHLLAEADRCRFPASSEAAIRSTVTDAVRRALSRSVPEGAACGIVPGAGATRLPSKGEVLEADIREILKDLPVYAREAAAAKGHQKPRDHEGRARRFVEALTGKRMRGRNSKFRCPDAWRPLAVASGRSNAESTFLLLARCCTYLGYAQAPARLPSYAEFMRAARALDIDERTVQTAMSLYRASLAAARAAHPGAVFAALPRGPIGHASHLGVELETLELLRQRGVPDPELLAASDLLGHIAPEIAADLSWCHTQGRGATLSASWREQCWGTAARVAGWMIRADRIGELGKLHLIDLIERSVDRGAKVINPRLARVAGGPGFANSSPGAAVTQVVCLLEDLAEREAAASVLRSPTAADDVKEAARHVAAGREGTKVWFTDAVYNNCVRLWSLIEAVYGEMAETEPERWALVRLRWERLKARLCRDRIPAAKRVNTKDKERMIRTVTLPQLVCVAMPLRLRGIQVLKAAWEEARRVAAANGFADPDAHPAVEAAYTAYVDRALPFVMMALAVDDGMRKQQYQRGRAGDERNLRFTFARDKAGKPTGIVRLETWWTGDRADPAHFKIVERDGRPTKREGRDVRPGYIPFDILWDLLTVWRPRTLLRAGAIPSLAAYDLDADMQQGLWALFPSPNAGVAVRRPERSRTDFESKVGRELHDCVREALRPDLPAWENLGPEWRSLWTQHVFRLLITSYWGGIRDDWTTAVYLTQDRERTLRDEYTAINAPLRDRLLLQHTHWEHPNAYDAWMDRLFGGREAFDVLEEPALPLPPAARGAIEAARAAAEARSGDSKRRRHRGAPRIRRPRPGQLPPRNDHA